MTVILGKFDVDGFPLIFSQPLDRSLFEAWNASLPFLVLFLGKLAI